MLLHICSRAILFIHVLYYNPPPAVCRCTEPTARNAIYFPLGARWRRPIMSRGNMKSARMGPNRPLFMYGMEHFKEGEDPRVPSTSEVTLPSYLFIFPSKHAQTEACVCFAPSPPVDLHIWRAGRGASAVTCVITEESQAKGQRRRLGSANHA